MWLSELRRSQIKKGMRVEVFEPARSNWFGEVVRVGKKFATVKWERRGTMHTYYQDARNSDGDVYLVPLHNVIPQTTHNPSTPSHLRLKYENKCN